jgi:hypothetical protein
MKPTNAQIRTAIANLEDMVACTPDGLMHLNLLRDAIDGYQNMEIIARHSRTTSQREWVNASTWLYHGQSIAIAGDES